MDESREPVPPRSFRSRRNHYILWLVVHDILPVGIFTAAAKRKAMTETAVLPAAAVARAEQLPPVQDVRGAVYLAGPKRIQSTPYWRATVDDLRRRFSPKNQVIVAGDGTCPGSVPVHKLKALVLIVPADGIVGYGSYVEVAQALQAKRPTWVSIAGELRRLRLAGQRSGIKRAVRPR